MLKQCRFLVVGGVACVAALSAPSWAFAQDEASIRSLPIDRWCEAEAARDLDAKMSLFTSDVVFLVPEEPPVVGRENVRAWHEAVWENTQHHCTGTVDEVEVFGDWGFVRGTFSSVVTDANGSTQDLRGKFLNMSRREADGTWRIARVIWNFD